MSENWFMAAMGIFLVVCGAFGTEVGGAMPGRRPGYPPTMRLRLILISFGIVMISLGVFRLVSRP
jgi:hypothetical protein